MIFLSGELGREGTALVCIWVRLNFLGLGKLVPAVQG